MKILKPEAKFFVASTTHELDEFSALAMMKHVERCGRICYKSEGNITEDSYKKFLANLIKRGHESVIEHASVTAIVTVDRGVTHEIVRHRIASYSQESTRYCNYSNGKFGGEVSFIDLRGSMELDPAVNQLPHDTKQMIFDEWFDACIESQQHYDRMLELGATPQIARSVLNNSVKADIVMTMNLREWRHFFRLRCSPAAHPAMREAAIPMLDEMYRLMPPIFEDIYQEVHA